MQLPLAERRLLAKLKVTALAHDLAARHLQQTLQEVLALHLLPGLLRVVINLDLHSLHLVLLVLPLHKTVHHAQRLVYRIIVCHILGPVLSEHVLHGLSSHFLGFFVRQPRLESFPRGLVPRSHCRLLRLRISHQQSLQHLFFLSLLLLLFLLVRQQVLIQCSVVLIPHPHVRLAELFPLSHDLLLLLLRELVPTPLVAQVLPLGHFALLQFLLVVLFQLGQLLRNGLVRRLQRLDQVQRVLALVLCYEGVGGAFVASPACSAHSVYVVFQVVRTHVVHN